MFRRTVLTVLGIRQLLTRLLQKPENSEKDLESQIPSPPLTFEDEVFRELSRNPFKDSLGKDAVDDQDEHCSISRESQHEGEEVQGEAPYAEGPARVFVHSDGKSKDILAVPVTKEMVSIIEEVISDKQALRKHQKMHDNLRDQVRKAEGAVENMEQDISSAENEDEIQRLQQQLDSHKSKAQKARTERDVLADRLGSFKLNLEISKDAVQTFFEEVFGDADLLETPNSDLDPDETERSEGKSDITELDANESDWPNPEELFRQAAVENLWDRRRELQATQEQWDTYSDAVEGEVKIYEDLLANEEPVPTRSVFDRHMLNGAMQITSSLIKDEKAYEIALEHAIAAGAVDSDFGKPQYWDEFAPESWTNEEEIAHQQTKDWSHVLDWIRMVPPISDNELAQPTDAAGLVDEVDDPNLPISEPMDIDEWDAKSIDLAQDSISVVAFDAYQSKSIRQWQKMTGHR